AVPATASGMPSNNSSRTRLNWCGKATRRRKASRIHGVSLVTKLSFVMRAIHFFYSIDLCQLPDFNGQTSAASIPQPFLETERASCRRRQTIQRLSLRMTMHQLRPQDRPETVLWFRTAHHDEPASSVFDTVCVPARMFPDRRASTISQARRAGVHEAIPEI